MSGSDVNRNPGAPGKHRGIIANAGPGRRALMSVCSPTHKKKEAAAITATAPSKNEKKIFASQSLSGPAANSAFETRCFRLRYSLAPRPQTARGRLAATSPCYSFGPAATSALPASLPSYFLKFLMKRAARSLAFSSHSAAVA